MAIAEYPYCDISDPKITSCADCHRWMPWFEKWVTDSRAAQGLPPKITDPLVLRQVATLMKPL